MAFTFTDWLDSQPDPTGQDVASVPAPVPPGQALRGVSTSQVARWALDGLNVEAIVSANLAPDPLSRGSAWGDSWAQGLATHMAALWSVALLEGPLADHPQLAQRWRRLASHEQASRFEPFARSNLHRTLDDRALAALERRILNDAVGSTDRLETSPIRPRL